MNILFISEVFPDAERPTYGIFNQELCGALAKEHKVQVLAHRAWFQPLTRGSVRSTFQPTTSAISQGLPVTFPLFWYVPKVFPVAQGRALWRSLKATITQSLSTFRPDAVISYWAFPDGAAGLAAARHFRVPSVVIVGGSDVLLVAHQADRGPCVRDVVRKSTAVVTVSEGLNRATINLGVDRGRVHTIRQGINREHFYPGDQLAAREGLNLPVDAKILIWVGRMAPVKNLDLLLAVMAKLVQNLPELRLYLIGDGDERRRLQRTADELGLSDHVRFQGAVGHDTLADWYRAADLTVLSSHSEGLPNVLRESLACGTPFVTTAVGSVDEIADLAFARTVPAGDAGLFAEAVTEVLNPRYRVAAARAEVRTWSACADDFTELIERLRRSSCQV